MRVGLTVGALLNREPQAFAFLPKSEPMESTTLISQRYALPASPYEGEAFRQGKARRPPRKQATTQGLRDVEDAAPYKRNLDISLIETEVSGTEGP